MTAIGQARPDDEEMGRRRELAGLLAGVRDLDCDYDSTIELARHLRAQRASAGQPTDIGVVLRDLEACLRALPPLLDDTVKAPRLAGPPLTAALERARREFDRRIRQHLAFAQTALEAP